MLLTFYFLGGHMIDYRKRKTTKCTDPECICWFCKNKKNTSLTKCKNGNCSYCEREYPNSTRFCENYVDRRIKE